jgi:hypothetical protein
MAVDTRNKRASCIGVGLPVPSVLPNPDSTIDSNDRQMVTWLYAGIAADSPTFGVVFGSLALLGVGI